MLLRSMLFFLAVLFGSGGYAGEKQSIQLAVSVTAPRVAPATPWVRPTADVTPTDYTGPCGASYVCVSGVHLDCDAPPDGSRPVEFLRPYRCFCEFASTCK